ncbi:MAG: lipopolysaccharide assembly protein LapA domain-containing protein [Actinomycetota bacterium]
MSTESRPTPTSTPIPPPSRKWIGPALLLIVVVTPFVILVASNTQSVTVTWTGHEWTAPMWLVLAATFVAGVVGGKLFGWLWRSWRRRRRRNADERDIARRLAGGQGG